jgi:ParB family chromosome partitioning protein
MNQMKKELTAALGNRPRQNLQKDVATTILGRAGQESSAPILLQLEQLVRSPFQSRGKRDEDYMENLVESIRAEGLLDPIIVRPLPAQALEEGCHTMTPPLPLFELVAGHHRVDAFRILGRSEIPAFVRYLTDTEAARALTSENTTRKGLSDWELYKHMAMLKTTGAVPNNTQMARVLNISRTTVQALDSFGALPPAAQQLLDDRPTLIGYNLARNLRPYCEKHSMIVFDALVRLAERARLNEEQEEDEQALSQSAVVGWIEKQINPKARTERREYDLAGGARLIVTPEGARLSGNFDYERLHKLLEENIHTLTVPE